MTRLEHRLAQEVKQTCAEFELFAPGDRVMVAMSGGLGLSIARIAAASVTIPATRMANSSATGSGFTALYSVAINFS